MIASVHITEKSFGSKSLYADLKISIQAGEKIGIIGRNGTGKSTLFNIITGQDTDYQGEVYIKQGITVASSRQEHHEVADMQTLTYVQGDLPEFARLQHILHTYPETMGDNPAMLQRYSDALERFSQLGYFMVEEELTQACQQYQLDPDILTRPLNQLSGGQKRLVELIKVQRSKSHLALIDEPTNHMDYVAKQAFVGWLREAQEAVVVITHDRDVLGEVDAIVEIRNGQAYLFKGNYKRYLQTNTTQITAQVNEYDVTQRRIKNLEADVIRFRRLKEKSRDPDTIKRFKSQENRARTELNTLQQLEKPSFWIDQNSAGDLNPKMSAAYGKYKSRNIRVRAKSTQSNTSQLLVQAHELSLRYEESPLFAPINFSLREGDRMRLHGRNGAGKTTIVQALLAKAAGKHPATTQSGSLAVAKELAIGVYQQEIEQTYLQMTLGEAIEAALRNAKQAVNQQRVKQVLGEYLFDPGADGDKPVEQLSGGQKARLQLIRMLLNDPSLLILDEPTNHLDLPSIEELENALKQYSGAIIYISHDSYFADAVGGETVNVSPAESAEVK